MSDTFKTVIGVDGCGAGWLGVKWQGQRAEMKLYADFASVMAETAEYIAVDMPIGLPEQHGRKAETEVRKVLGARRSSVFSTPARAAFDASDWIEACSINMRHSNPQRKMSKQSFGLFSKIKEIDALITPAIQQRVHEVHPEVSFHHMNNQKPLIFGKKTRNGEAERQNLLRSAGFPAFDLSVQTYLRKDVARDDIIDACACAWTARRIHINKQRSYPLENVVDERGLQMCIKA